MASAFILRKNEVKITSLTAFLNVNGYDWPAPARGFQYVFSTALGQGRNANNAVVGQRVGRDLIKLDAMNFVCLSPETRMMMLQSLEPFFVPVTFENYRTGRPITLIMYPGDRKGKPLFADERTHMITMDESFTVNLIDAGWE